MICDPNSLLRSHVLSELEIGHQIPSRGFYLSSNGPDWPLSVGQGCCPCSGEISDDLKPADGTCFPCHSHVCRRQRARRKEEPLPLRPALTLLLQELERVAFSPRPQWGQNRLSRDSMLHLPLVFCFLKVLAILEGTRSSIFTAQFLSVFIFSYAIFFPLGNQ